MSFLGFGRPQPSSAEKIAAVEAEMKLMADMMNRYVAVDLFPDFSVRVPHGANPKSLV